MMAAMDVPGVLNQRAGSRPRGATNQGTLTSANQSAAGCAYCASDECAGCLAMMVGAVMMPLPGRRIGA